MYVAVQNSQKYLYLKTLSHVFAKFGPWLYQKIVKTLKFVFLKN